MVLSTHLIPEEPAQRAFSKDARRVSSSKTGRKSCRLGPRVAPPIPRELGCRLPAFFGHSPQITCQLRRHRGEGADFVGLPQKELCRVGHTCSTARAALRVPIFLFCFGGLGPTVEFLGPDPELRPCRFGSRSTDHLAALLRHPSEELCAHGGRPRINAGERINALSFCNVLRRHAADPAGQGLSRSL